MEYKKMTLPFLILPETEIPTCEDTLQAYLYR
jgi:hypothetical protein